MGKNVHGCLSILAYALVISSVAYVAEADQLEDRTAIDSIAAAESNAFNNLDTLEVISVEGGTPLSGHGTYDLGKINLLDDSYTSKKYRVMRTEISGLTHVFTVRNSAQRDMQLEKWDSDCTCTFLLLEEKRLPLILKPGETAKVRMIVDHSILSPGKMSTTAWLFSKDQKRPVASFNLTGLLEGGVTFSQDKLNFPIKYGETGQKAYFSLTLDRRMTTELFFVNKFPVRVLSTNPAFKVRIVAPVRTKEYSIAGNSIKFNEASLKPLEKDLKLNYELIANDNLPIGPIESAITIKIPEMPNLMLFRNNRLPISGTVTGSISADSYNLYLRRKGTSAISLAETIITVKEAGANPLTVTSNDPNLLVTLSHLQDFAGITQVGETPAGDAKEGPSVVDKTLIGLTNVKRYQLQVKLKDGKRKLARPVQVSIFSAKKERLDVTVSQPE